MALVAEMNVLVVDDHLLVAQAVGGLVTEQCGLRLLGVCASVREALAVMEATPPDLLILDVHLPGERWQECASALQRLKPTARLLMLTGMADQFHPPPQIRPLLLGVVDKARGWDDLIAVIQQWQQRREGARAGSSTSWIRLLDLLTPRERGVFDRLGQGLATKQIAHALGLTSSTVETYRKRIAATLGLSGAELVRAACLFRCTSSAGNALQPSTSLQPHQRGQGSISLSSAPPSPLQRPASSQP